MPLLIPLITPISKKYFMKATQDNETYYNALDLRLCLEKIADTMVAEFIPANECVNFKKLTLHQKLLKAKTFMPDEIIDRLIKVKALGNEGAHEGQEACLTKEDIQDALQHIMDFSLALFVVMLRKYGLYTPGGSWIAPVLSTLPPIYRIQILEEYIKYEQSPLAVEKLSMAYLKNDMEEQAFQILNQYYKAGTIDDYFYESMKEKLGILKPQLRICPIAKDLQMAKENFNQLLLVIPKEKQNDFILLMSLILNENNG